MTEEQYQHFLRISNAIVRQLSRLIVQQDEIISILTERAKEQAVEPEFTVCLGCGTEYITPVTRCTICDKSAVNSANY